MRGRKPRPTHLKLVTGNPGGRPLNPNEPKPEPAIPAVPPHLPDAAKVEWGRVAHWAYDLGILTQLDRAVLAAYCAAYADWVKYSELVERHGPVTLIGQRKVTRVKKDGTAETEESGGYPQQSVYVSMANKAEARMVRAAAEFGFTPSSRSRVNVEPGSAGRSADPASKYLR